MKILDKIVVQNENKIEFFSDLAICRRFAAGFVDRKYILATKVIIEKSRVEVSLMEQDTIENIS